jgi:hypothetical protein
MNSPSAPKATGGKRFSITSTTPETPPPPYFLHEVLLVRLIDSSTFIFGIAGAQHGHYEPVIPWNKYMRERVVSINEINSFGDQEQVLEENFKASNNTIQAATRLTHGQAVKCLNHPINEWLDSQKITLAELLKALKQVYEEKSAKFLAYISKEVTDFLDWADGTAAS